MVMTKYSYELDDLSGFPTIKEALRAINQYKKKKKKK
jgi:hypothetical protein